MFANEQDFIQRLYDAGWTDARDAQHENIRAVYREIEAARAWRDVGIRLHENAMTLRKSVEVEKNKGWSHYPIKFLELYLLPVAGESFVA